MTDLIDTTEMYLRTIFELEEEGIVPLRARIAERLGHSGPTVSQTVARMERDGLLTVGDERHLELSEQGRLTAMRVMRKHRLAERLLVDVLGLEWPLAHDEACRWEHVISDHVERRILVLLRERGVDAEALLSPYGNPIPGLGELGADAPDEVFRDGVASLTGLAAELGGQGTTREVVVRRIGEPAQADPEVLATLDSVGVTPGAVVRISLRDNGVQIVNAEYAADAPAVLSVAVASHVFASARD
ncbi:MAG TPA: metal-dependent transcriptional regulator [Dermatophilaceae bacterium]|nr:metal-dependent transcriptional regulator [Dermatophilaceae bacterium]